MAVKQLINSALRKLGVIGAKEEADAREISDALNQLNRMLNNWSVQPNNIYKIVKEDFTLTSGTSEYTFGAGGTFNSARPTKIIRCTYASGGVDHKIVETTAENYADIGLKTLESLPEMFWYNPEYPLGRMTFYPVPDDAYTITVYSKKPLAQYTNSANDVNLPPEYESAIEFNLAIELSAEYTSDPPAVVVARAQST